MGCRDSVWHRGRGFHICVVRAALCPMVCPPSFPPRSLQDNGGFWDHEKLLTVRMVSNSRRNIASSTIPAQSPQSCQGRERQGRSEALSQPRGALGDRTTKCLVGSWVGPGREQGHGEPRKPECTVTRQHWQLGDRGDVSCDLGDRRSGWWQGARSVLSAHAPLEQGRGLQSLSRWLCP